RGYSPMTVRFFFLMGHYTSTLDFSNEALQAAERGYRRMLSARAALDQVKPSASGDTDVAALRNQCYDAMNDDFNTPILISVLFEMVRIMNSAKEGSVKLTADDINLMRETFDAFFYQVMGLKDEASAGDNELTGELMELILKLRAEAKMKKDFATSDQIRDALTTAGVAVKDTKEGTTWEVNK
ncbi:MAG: cysteine--tRNA ligase, partial [Flavobacteriales bacterium]|nr:cysteine--tRNA ligase [Flavobacteriales bacterium]